MEDVDKERKKKLPEILLSQIRQRVYFGFLQILGFSEICLKIMFLRLICSNQNKKEHQQQ